MDYTPPTSLAVDFKFPDGVYAPPASLEVDFGFFTNPSPGTATLTLAGYAPTPFVTSHHVLVEPGAGLLTLTGYAPIANTARRLPGRCTAVNYELLATTTNYAALSTTVDVVAAATTLDVGQNCDNS
jgi:hypothetical protein